MKPKFITKYTCKYYCKEDAVLVAEDKTLWYTDLKGLHSANDTLNIESCELLVKKVGGQLGFQLLHNTKERTVICTTKPIG